MGRSIHAIVFWALLVSGPLIAQTSRGSIKGTVADPSRLGVPQVEVRAKNVGTAIVSTATTSAEGDFTLLNLLPGTYELSAEAAGFKRALFSDVLVHASTITRVDIVMELGSVNQSVEVTGAAPVITPDSVEAGTVITTTEYENLPLSGAGRVRTPTEFVLLTPGVTGYTGGSTRSGYGQLSVNGSEGQQTDVIVDGMSAGQAGQFGSYLEMASPVDAIGEFKVVTGVLSAEYGLSATAVMNFSLRSGTNQYHGSLFEVLRNTQLNGRTFFQVGKLAYHQNNFGGTASGPVRIPFGYNGRNRTFFMASSDNSFFRGAETAMLYTSPTAAFLKGDFSTLKTSAGTPRLIYDPATNAPDGKGGVTRTPFAGNLIPQNRFHAITRRIAEMYPTPNLPGNDSNFTGIGWCPDMNNYYFNTKVDHRFTDKHSISSSYNYTFVPRDCWSNPYVGTPLLGGSPPQQDFSSKNFRLTYDYVITPRILNHWQFGYNRFLNAVTGFGAGQGWPEKLGIKGVGGDGSLPYITFASDGYPALSTSRWDKDVEENIMFRDTTSIVTGRHNLKFGFESRSPWYKKRALRNLNGTFTFSNKETGLYAGNSTGNSFASFLLGSVDSASISTPEIWASRRPYYAFFVQDDLKLNPRLTFNLGLRYDLELPPYEQYDRSSIFDLGAPNPAAGSLPGAMAFAGTGSDRLGRRAYVDAHYRNFGPRIGLAYQVKAGMVIRVGYGINYTTHRLWISNTGFSNTASFISPDNGNTPAFWIDQGMPTDWPKPPFINPAFGNNNNVTTFVRGEAARMPMTQLWRFDIQRQLPGGMAAEIAYVGTRGTHQNAAGLRNFNQVSSRYLSLGNLLTANINSPEARAAGIPIPYPGFTGTVRQALRPFPQVLTITSMEDKLGSSIYHAFQFKVQKRFAGGLHFLVSYTNSKLLTDNDRTFSAGDATVIQDAGNRRAERAVAVFDVPQMFWLAMIYNLPFGPGKPFLNRGGAVGKIVGGWSISPIVNYCGGLPLPITQNNQLALFNSSQRPNRVPGVKARNDISYGDFDPAIHRLFNPAAFVSPGPQAFGDAPPRLAEARNFGLRKEDLSLRKDTRLTEGMRLEFNVQAFNLLNRNQWGNANASLSSSDFGKITGTGPARNIQLGMKLHF